MNYATELFLTSLSIIMFIVVVSIGITKVFGLGKEDK